MRGFLVFVLVFEFLPAPVVPRTGGEDPLVVSQATGNFKLRRCLETLHDTCFARARPR